MELLFIDYINKTCFSFQDKINLLRVIEWCVHVGRLLFMLDIFLQWNMQNNFSVIQENKRKQILKNERLWIKKFLFWMFLLAVNHLRCLKLFNSFATAEALLYILFIAYKNVCVEWVKGLYGRATQICYIRTRKSESSAQ